MNRYSSARDLTASQPRKSPGVSALRRCWACNQNRSQAGGKLDTRTRLWRCAACAPKGEK